MAITPALSAPVGPGQPNRPDDLRLLRQALNDFSNRGFLQPPLPLAAEGGWDATVAAALQAVENQYFFGEADPDNKLQTNDTLFQFLVQCGQDSQRLAASLSSETYGPSVRRSPPAGATWAWWRRPRRGRRSRPGPRRSRRAAA